MMSMRVSARSHAFSGMVLDTLCGELVSLMIPVHPVEASPSWPINIRQPNIIVKRQNI